MIELKNVTYKYENNQNEETFAVKNVSLTVEDGEFWGIIGHTGSGKSTLTELMSGLIKPTDGSVSVDEIDVKNTKNAVRALRGKVGMVFQYPEHQLFEETVLKDVCFGPKNMGLDDEECKNRAREAMKLAGLGEEYEEMSPFELSGGQKRRAAIAGVIAMKPSTLILDEPTAGLDPCGRDALIDMLMGLRGTWLKSIVLVSHSMEDIARCADKVLVMKKGEVLLQGNVRDVFAQEDVLRQSGLDVPQITRLMGRLKKMGYDFRGDVLSVEEATEEIKRKFEELGLC